MYKIFLVEDDDAIAASILSHLEDWGWESRRAGNLTRVMEEFSAFMPHLVLLDIGLPYRNGYHWCSEIRRLSQVPILFLSSASDKMPCCGGPMSSAPARRCWSTGARCWTPGTTPSPTMGKSWS